MLADLVGELLWVLIYGEIGYLFASQWEVVHQLISDFTGLSIVITIILGISAFILFHRKNTARP